MIPFDSHRFRNTLRELSKTQHLSRAALLLFLGVIVWTACLFAISSCFVTAHKPPPLVILICSTLPLGLAAMWFAHKRLFLRDPDRDIEDRHPKLRGLVKSSRELLLHVNAPTSPFSPDLLQRQLSLAEERLRSIPWTWSVQSSHLVVLCALFALVIDAYFARLAVIRLKVPVPFTVADFLAPSIYNGVIRGEISALSLKYTYPAYTRRKSVQHINSSGAISTLKGTEVTITCTLLGGIGVSRLSIIYAGQRIPLQQSPGQHYAGSFPILSPGSYQFEAQSEDGKKQLFPKKYPVDMQNDEIPQVTISFPAKDMELNKQDSLEIGYAWRDDFSVTAAELVVNIDKAMEKVFPLTAAQTPEGKGSTVLALSDLGLYGGEDIMYLIRIHDGDTISGPKHGDSPAFHISISSQAKRLERVLRQLDAFKEAAITWLAESITATKSTSDSELLISTAKIVALLGPVVQAFPDLLKDLEAAAIHPEQYAAMAHLRSRLETLYAQRAEQLRSHRTSLLRQGLSVDVSTAEGAVLLIEELQAKVGMQSVQDLTAAVNELKQQLREALAAYRQNPTPEGLQKIQELINRIQSAMAKINEQLDRFKKDGLDDYVNADAMKQYQENNDPKAIAELLKQGKQAEAMELAEKVLGELDNFTQELSQQGDSAEDKRHKELTEALMTIEDQLTAARAKQNEILRETKKIGSDESDEASIKELVEKIRDLIASIQENTRDIAVLSSTNARIQGFQRAFLLRLSSRTSTLGNLLEQQDWAGLYHLAKSISAQLPDLERQRIALGKQDIDLGDRIARNRVIEKAERIHSQYGELLKLIEQLLMRGKAQKPEERSKMDELARREKQVAEQFEQTRKKLDQLRGKNRAVAEAFGSEDEEISGRLADAQKHLEDYDPRNSTRSEEDALSKLDSLLGKMRNAKQQAQKQRSSGQRRARSAPPQEIKIPQKEEDKSWVDRNKSISEALQDPIPKQYEPQVKKYYEAILGK